ncbi:glycosyltransferase [Pseudoxanthomonas wuyuanensis]|uniref:Glycosyl transferases group 1 n=1 Tax=Pseudoxanthomonas wuyuanensis TaxID=1073196 RepID=A0A286D808_9GAMM|nr:glycosyltransferase [Pseudoxanthomonas wuyuanensis]KAF1720135.1 glycosyltransferase [Pseudoxanthomonas wuyuanensis]SOD54802.1 Glycosyl transferases group 1 [Pseudoxanthomonas wuyuanensis]
MLRVNLIAWDNGVGLSRDLKLIADTLRDAGIGVDIQPARGRGKLRKWLGPWWRRARVQWRRWRSGPAYDLNLMLEHVRPELLGAARRNAFIPNPEWCQPADVKRLHRMDHVLAKTGHAVDIFRQRECAVMRIGFTSMDRHDPEVPRLRTFFHLAGRSSAKQTQLVLETWARHPEWPLLTVVQHPRSAKFRPQADNIAHRIDYLDDAELRRLQNESLFHLCPSETEGFGHYLMEALSVGAVTLTTDAAPMNELVTPERGLLIPFARTASQQLATRYQVDAGAIEAAVQAALDLSAEEILARSRAAREFFIDNDATFRHRLVQAVREASGRGIAG